MTLNYGLNRVRFTSPVPSGAGSAAASGSRTSRTSRPASRLASPRRSSSRGRRSRPAWPRRSSASSHPCRMLLTRGNSREVEFPVAGDRIFAPRRTKWARGRVRRDRQSRAVRGDRGRLRAPVAPRARGHGPLGGAGVRHAGMGDRGRSPPAEDPENLAGKVVQRLDLAILVLFPYLLYRFAAAFEPSSPAARARSSTRSAPRSSRRRSCSRPCPPRARRGRGGSSSTRSPSSCTGRCCSPRRRPALAGRQRRGVRRAQADADARVRLLGAHRRSRLRPWPPGDEGSLGALAGRRCSQR